MLQRVAGRVARAPLARAGGSSLKRPRVDALVATALAFNSAFRRETCFLDVRHISATARVCHGPSHRGPDAKLIHVHWVRKSGEVVETDAAVGDTLLQTAHHHGIELEGACEGVCACSTCHVVLEGDVYDRLDAASEEEEDMLDQAFAITPTSRLGCQVVVDESMDGMKIKLPAATRNFYVDGHVPKPH